MTLILDEVKKTSNAKRIERTLSFRGIKIETHLNQNHLRVSRVAGIPTSLIELYVDAAARHLFLSEVDDIWFAEVKGLEGIYGEGDSRAEAIQDFVDSLPSWVELKIQAGAELPEINGVSLPSSYKA